MVPPAIAGPGEQDGRPPNRRPKPWIVPIPGTRKLECLDENNGAAEVELTADDLREIEEAAAKITVQGERYSEALEKRTGL